MAKEELKLGPVHSYVAPERIVARSSRGLPAQTGLLLTALMTGLGFTVNSVGADCIERHPSTVTKTA